MNTLDAIKARHSTRGFSDKQIPDADLEKILFAGGQAAVGGADFKSLKLYAVQDPELLKTIDESSAKMRPGSHPLYGAPTLVVLASKESILKNIEFTNAGCVIQNMMVAAADLGIDSRYSTSATSPVRSSSPGGRTRYAFPPSPGRGWRSCVPGSWPCFGGRKRRSRSFCPTAKRESWMPFTAAEK